MSLGSIIQWYSGVCL